ncbi:hypothetical protein [Cellulosimicrobium arenosum]|uniref:Integral membrane protein n=1 Tax=Cellulosimicrobium arenosum TaxID=2708133 RepID=A0A927G6H9_9MICO|nr:hypothetical protein [Cellulosimicrobium arenosum]MBD8077777.1 hypothetical protein [Cellulosimicrobium arenosum]
MDWFTVHVVDTGRSPALAALVGFVVTFVVVRSVTRRIRARSSTEQEPAPTGARPRRRLLGDLTIGGVHVHHQVWGILLVLLTGMLQFRYSPGHPWTELLALLFGAGAALALDEFALWFYLDDVYWSEEGQRSIDAILVGGALGAALLFSGSPVGVTTDASSGGSSFWTLYTVVVVAHLALAFVCLLKGKLATGLIGIVVPLVATVGAIRLAKPSSFWARRRYAGRPGRLARARRRFGPQYYARRARVRAALGGRASGPPEDQP